MAEDRYNCYNDIVTRVNQAICGESLESLKQLAGEVRKAYNAHKISRELFWYLDDMIQYNIA